MKTYHNEIKEAGFFQLDYAMWINIYHYNVTGIILFLPCFSKV